MRYFRVDEDAANADATGTDVNGKIDLDFLQGGVMGVDGNPIVNAIEVLSS
jgi:hypothetical protein